MVLKLSRSTNSTASDSLPRCARSTVRIQIGEELPPVRQVRERIVMRQMSQLPRALRDAIFELAPDSCARSARTPAAARPCD